MNLLMDAAEMWTAVERDIANARDEVELQTLSLEADGTDWRLAELLMSSGARRKRAIVDSSLKHLLCGRQRAAVPAPLSAELQARIAVVERRLHKLESAAVQVRFSNPVAVMMERMPARNHKKTITIDRHVSYLGGIDFSDYSLAWYGPMLRVESSRIADALRTDFEASWQGRHRGCYVRTDGIQLHTLDGTCNRAAFDMLFTRIQLAGNEIVVHTPYLTFPFREHLQRVAARGIKVTIVSSRAHTIVSLRKYIGYPAAQALFERNVAAGMSHFKAMLIDESCLVLGSSNFDYLSYRVHQAVLVYITDTTVIEKFRRRVLERAGVSLS